MCWWAAYAQAGNINSNPNAEVSSTSEAKAGNPQATKPDLGKDQSAIVGDQSSTKEKMQQNPDQQNLQGNAEGTPAGSSVVQSEQQEQQEQPLDLRYDSSTVKAKQPVEKPAKKQKLPDFTRTYGYDANPDIKFRQKKVVPKTGKEKVKAFKKKLRRKFSKTTKKGSRYGFQRYTRSSGKKKTGLGYSRKNKKKKTKSSLTLHQNGLSFDRKVDKFNYHIGVDDRSPITLPGTADDEPTYMFFGIGKAF